MANSKVPCGFVLLSVIVSLAIDAPAQEIDAAPSRGRFLDLLEPGQRVRVDDMGRDDPSGIQVTLVPDAQWKEIEGKAEERMNRIQELEKEIETLHKERHDTFSILQRFQPGERTGLDQNAVKELQQAQQQFYDKLQSIHAKIDALRRKLPSNVNQVEVVGEDYFGIDTENAVVFYPASRLREVIKPKETAKKPDRSEGSAPPENRTDSQSGEDDPSSADDPAAKR